VKKPDKKAADSTDLANSPSVQSIESVAIPLGSRIANTLAYNGPMRTPGTDLRDAVDHLPEAAVLTIDPFAWEDYEQLLQEMEDHPGRRSHIVMYELRDRSYVEIPSSRSFPILTGGVLIHFIEQSRVQGQMAALAAFREWIKSGKV